MKIVLQSLHLRNFKGVFEQTINFSQSTFIYGANESGKSTTHSAFCWLLTGKDEFDRKDFELKNTSKKELNTQAHEVEAVLLVDSREIKLKRVYFENWQKPKGQSTKEFKGHSTEFYYDDVPVSATDYQSKVDVIMPSNIIKLLTNPTYFNSLKWDDQRRALMLIAGEITNNEVIDSIATPDNDYSYLINALSNGESLEEWKKRISTKKGLLKKAAAEFTPRIDEVKLSKPEAKDWAKIEAEIKQLNTGIEVCDMRIANSNEALKEQQQAINQKQSLVFEKEQLIATIRNGIKSKVNEERRAQISLVQKLESDLRTLTSKIQGLKNAASGKESNIAFYTNKIAEKEQSIVHLRDEWKSINSEVFAFDESSCTCPTCKQSLPVDNIEAQKVKMLENFNASVLKRKAEKVELSNQVKAEKAQFEVKLNELQNADGNDAEIEKLTQEQTRLQTQILIESKKTTTLIPVDIAVEELIKLNGDALNALEEIAAINVEINTLKSQLGNVDNASELNSKREYQLQIDTLKRELGDRDAIEKADKRIAELQHDEQINAQAIADLEQQEFEAEAFSKAKMDILQTRVNQLFKHVTFRMFDTQVNGAIVETCICEYKGVPYPTLNTAAKLLAGLDVINTLSNFYKIFAPVFCDNRESVTEIPAIESQVISLFVSPSDKKLRVEQAA